MVDLAVIKVMVLDVIIVVVVYHVKSEFSKHHYLLLSCLPFRKT